jgi:hypothetical protein
VTFEPLAGLSDKIEQLHLAHPFVKRILDRFLAQGFSAHDLGRVSSVVAPNDSVIRVVAYARLSLFGPGAARLHDEIIAVAAPWSGGDGIIEPYKDAATTAKTIEATERLLALNARAPSPVVQARITEQASRIYAGLWTTLDHEADARAVASKNGLSQRARREADELRALLRRQKKIIAAQIKKIGQSELFASTDTKTDKEQQRQLALDLEHMQGRHKTIDAETATEPKAIESLYEVRMTRLSPVGLVVSWPEAMT